MKKYLIVILLLLAAAVSAQAQDLVTTKDGRIIRAKVTEVTPELIKYKNASNLNGPLYSLKRSDVKTILYENGMVDNFDSPKAGAAPVSSYISPEAQANAEAKAKAEADSNAEAKANAAVAADETPVVKSPAEAMPEVRPATPEEVAAAEKAEAEQAEASEDTESDTVDAPWDSNEVPFHYNVRYNDIKYDYDTRYYHHESGDPFSPGLSGFASMCVPGLGQCLDGEWGRGVAFFFGQSALSFVGLTSLAMLMTRSGFPDSTESMVHEIAAPVFLGTLGAQAVLWVWNICDAAHIAKVKNMYYQDYDRFSTTMVDFRLEPSFAFTPSATGNFAPSAGVSLKLSF